MAQETWTKTPGPERGAVLRAAGIELAERTDELVEALDLFHYFAGQSADLGREIKESSSRETHLYVEKEPVGVVSRDGTDRSQR